MDSVKRNWKVCPVVLIRPIYAVVQLAHLESAILVFKKHPVSHEQLKAFLEKVKADTSLQEKLKAASDADAVVAIAKEAGFSISADDLKSTQSEISDEELEGVAGGHFHLGDRNSVHLCSGSFKEFCNWC